MKYIVSYDLVAPGQDYKTLWDELRRLGAQKVLESQWALNVNNTAEQLRDHLKKYIDKNDRLLVNGLENTDWASYNAKIKLKNI